MLTISIISEKGGVGKSKLTTSLAVAFVQGGYLTTVFDLDAQSTSAKWKERRQDDLPLVEPTHAAMLARELERVEKAGCEVALIDTAPHASQDALTAARAADLVLVPIGVSIDDIETLPKTFDLLKLAGTPFSVVLNKVSPSGKSEADEAEEGIKGLGGNVCPVRIVERVAHKRSGGEGQSGQEYIPDGAKEPDRKAVKEIHQLYMYVCSCVDMPTTNPQEDDHEGPPQQISGAGQAA